MKTDVYNYKVTLINTDTVCCYVYVFYVIVKVVESGCVLE